MLPPNRQLKKLSEIGIFIRGVSYKKPELLQTYQEGCVTLLRANNIQGNKLDLSDVQYLPNGYTKSEQITKENDILFCMSSGSSHLVGKNVQLQKLDNFSFGAFCSIFRLNESNTCDIDYLSHYLQGNTYFEYITNISRGAGINNLRNSDLEDFEIPLPPLATQHKIVETLDQASAQITASKSAILSQLDALDQLWQSSLSEVFENPTVPTKSISEITSLLGDGLHGTPKYDDQGEYYFINGNNLDNGNIVIKDGTKKVSITEYEKYKKNLNDRTILVSINGTIGNVAFYNNEKVVLGKSACYFNLLDNVDKSYVKYAIMSPYFIQYANKELTGTTIKNVSLKTMRAFQIPLPDLTTQTRIVSQLDDFSQTIASLRSQYTAQLQHFDNLRASILDQAFKGELVEE